MASWGVDINVTCGCLVVASLVGLVTDHPELLRVDLANSKMKTVGNEALMKMLA